MLIWGETQPGRLSDNAIPLRILPARHRFPKKRSKPLIRVSERRWYILTATKYQSGTIKCNINRYFFFCCVCRHSGRVSGLALGKRERERKDAKNTRRRHSRRRHRDDSGKVSFFTTLRTPDDLAQLRRSKRKLLSAISLVTFSSAPLRLCAFALIPLFCGIAFHSPSRARGECIAKTQRGLSSQPSAHPTTSLNFAVRNTNYSALSAL
jgi:hypothetical protein